MENNLFLFIVLLIYGGTCFILGKQHEKALIKRRVEKKLQRAEIELKRKKPSMCRTIKRGK